jgi:hypothetical protein
MTPACFFLAPILCATLLVSTTRATNPYYYTTPGLVVNSDSCSASYCKACSPGFYNLNCGGASNGTCTACPPFPANSVYAAWGASPDGILTAAPSLCPFDCVSNAYIKNASACTAGVCPVSFSVANSQYVAGVTYPTCVTECKPGYYGSATSPTSCTQCSPGSWSDRGATACTQCVLGKYQNAYAETTCKDCAMGTGYADTPGQSACKPCANCATGYYKSGCGLSSAGTCPACNVPTSIV